MAWVDAADEGSATLDLHVATAGGEAIVSGCDGLMDQRNTICRDALHRELSAPDRGEEGCAVYESKEAGCARQDDSGEFPTVRVTHGVLSGEHLGRRENLGQRSPELVAEKSQQPAPELVHLFHGFQPKEDAHLGAEFVGRERLHDVIVGAGLESADALFDLRVPGHENHLEVPEGPFRAQHPAQVVPVDDGHHDIEKNESRLQPLGDVQCRLRVGQRRDVVLVPEKLFDDG